MSPNEKADGCEEDLNINGMFNVVINSYFIANLKCLKCKPFFVLLINVPQPFP